MEKIPTNLMAALVAVGLIAYTGCGAKEDPDAAKNATEEEVDANHTGDEEDDPEPTNVPAVKANDTGKGGDNEAPPKEDC